jgi:hypothetical protein
MALPADSGSKVAAVGTENPALGKPKDQWMQLDLTEEDIAQTVEIASMYAAQWAVDRQIRMRVWTKNILFYRGLQLIEWHAESGNWVDLLSWYAGSDKVKEGESTELAKFQHPITRMLGQTFIGNMSREVPLTVVKPEDPRILADMTTATAGSDAISIIERRNNIRQMTRGEFEFLYLYGAYFKHTRGVLDGIFSGYDDEPVIGEMDFASPARMQCLNCGTETPISELNETGIDGDNDGDETSTLPNCPNCGTGMGPESFHEAGAGATGLTVLGMRKVPRAMVKQTIHSGMEIDTDPEAKELDGVPLLKCTVEIDIGEARMMFPDAWDKIQEGAEDSTSGIASYEKLQRNMAYSMGGAYTTDTTQQRPSYSQIWFQPMAYMRKGDKEYAARMMAAAPEGLRLTMLGGNVVGVKKAVLTKEWSGCRLFDAAGIYGQSIAENVVTFNERFNSAMNAYDDYMMRAPFGLNIVDGCAIDTEKTKGNKWAPTTMVPVYLKQGAVLANIFQHNDIPVNPGLALYPQMLWMFAQLLNGLPAQVSGGGTNPDVETFGGQAQQLDQAGAGLAPFFENVKEEHAQAAQNALECLQELLKCGAASEIWDVIQDEGSEFRANYVNLAKMQGRVKVYPDEDQDLPQTPEQIRQSCQQLMTELSAGNPGAQAIMDVPVNQESIGKILYPWAVQPSKAQRAKTLQDMNTLMKTLGTPIVQPDGSIGIKLPAEPSILENMEYAIPTVQEFAIENSEIRINAPAYWSQIEMYLGKCQEVQATQGMKKAALELKVKQAGLPQPSGPDPAEQEMQAEMQQLMQAAGPAIIRLAQIMQMDPMETKGTANAQVSAAKEIVDTTVDAVKLVTKDKK